MVEIGQLPPAPRISPSYPGKGAGEGNRAPQRKPDSERGQPDQHHQRRKNKDDKSGIDEYA